MSTSRHLEVLVTGGAGYIGSHVALALLDNGYGVTVLDNLSTGRRGAVPGQANFVKGDCGDRACIDTLARQRQFAAILHFAGSIVGTESVNDPLTYYRNNTVNTQTTIEAAVANGIRHFIFASTAAVYGPSSDGPVREDAVPRPASPYGASKLMAEMILRDVAQAYPLNYCSLRYFNVAGADPQGRAAGSGASGAHLIKVAVDAVLGRRRDVPVFGGDYATPDGTAIRDYIHVADIASAHVAALETLIRQPGQSFTLNCGFGRGHSVTEVLDAVDRVTGTKVRRVLRPRRAYDVAILVADSGRLRETLGWRPRFSELETIVSDALAWERQFTD
jgi:UDP-glucose 4-epimerase